MRNYDCRSCRARFDGSVATRQAGCQSFARMILLAVMLCGITGSLSAGENGLSKTSGSSAAAAEQEDLTVLPRWIEWSDGSKMLLHHLNRAAFALLDERDQAIANLGSQNDWMKRQQYVKQTLLELMGPFPEKTPLNARVLGVLHEDGYRVERIVYESMPGFYVTGCVFVPEGLTEKRPAILKLIGHNAPAFRDTIYQNVILNLVHKGFIVLTIDPIGQGERLQYYDEERKKSAIGMPSLEHSYTGIQCLLAGYSVARYFAWDAIRAIDYLEARDDVDSDRIGVTGLSGGGAQTAYVSALDDRVKASAPTCWIVSMRRLLASDGPQDAEQNIYHGVVHGIDPADLLTVRAPKPTLLVATSRDKYFSIQGVRETAQEVAGAFEAFGKPERFQYVEDDAPHAFTRKNNEATYAFFQKYLDLPGSPDEQEYPFLTREELTATPTGQVTTSFDSETVFSVNRRESMKLLDRLETARKDPAAHLQRVVSKARELAGYQEPIDGLTPVFRGGFRHEEYRIEKYGLAGEGETVIPLLVFVPNGGQRFPAVIYVHPDDKATDARPGGPIETLVKQGYLVAALDPLGSGETASELWTSQTAWAPYYNAVLCGRSVVGIQAGDIVRVMRFLQTRDDVREDSFCAVGIGEMGPSVLYAAAFEPAINSIVLTAAPVSYASMVLNQYYEFGTNCMVGGALTAYDLPDLIASLAPRKVALLNLSDQMKQPASDELLEQSLAFPRSAYVLRQAADRIKILTTGDDHSLAEVLDWCLQP